MYRRLQQLTSPYTIYYSKYVQYYYINDFVNLTKLKLKLIVVKNKDYFATLSK